MIKGFVMRYFLLICVVVFFSCNMQQKEENVKRINHTKESLQEINKNLIEKDNDIIKSYVDRRGWDMKNTETGLWFMIYKNNDSPRIQEGELVKYNYKVRLFDGSLCYSSDKLGAKSIIAGQGGIESGLEEGLLLLSKGCKARFIIPPHLAHGLIGDEDKIPARAIIIYDIEILETNNLN